MCGVDQGETGSFGCRGESQIEREHSLSGLEYPIGEDRNRDWLDGGVR